MVRSLKSLEGGSSLRGPAYARPAVAPSGPLGGGGDGGTGSSVGADGAPRIARTYQTDSTFVLRLLAGSVEEGADGGDRDAAARA